MSALGAGEIGEVSADQGGASRVSSREMNFEDALADLGFQRSDARATRGASLYSAGPNRFMTYSVHVYEDGTALFSWEFAIADYLATKGIQIGSDEALNQFVFPREDIRGPQDSAWLVGAIDRTEASLRELRFHDPEA